MKECNIEERFLCRQLLEKNLQLLMDSVDNLQQETYRLLGYEKNVSKQLQQKQQFIQRRVSNAWEGLSGHICDAW